MLVLRQLGARVEIISPSSLIAIATYTAIVSRVEGDHPSARPDARAPGDYAIHLSARIYGGYAIPGTAYLEALAGAVAAPLLRRCLRRLRHRGDAHTGSRVPTPAETDIDADPKIRDRFMALSANTRPFNYLGLLTIALPAGFDDRGLPVGLQLAARPLARRAAARPMPSARRIGTSATPCRELCRHRLDVQAAAAGVSKNAPCRAAGCGARRASGARFPAGQCGSAPCAVAQGIREADRLCHAG